MKKLTASLAVVALAILPFSALAFNAPNEPTGDLSDVSNIVSALMGKVWILFAALAVVLFVFSGVKFLTAGGAAEKIQEARSAFMWGVVGVVVMILSYSIFAIATNIIGGQ